MTLCQMLISKVTRKVFMQESKEYNAHRSKQNYHLNIFKSAVKDYLYPTIYTVE
jgi:hypothetical protein